MRAIPLEVRKAIVKCYTKVRNVKYVCSLFEVSKSSVMLFVRKERQCKTLEPAKKTQPMRFNAQHRKSIVLWALRTKLAKVSVSNIIVRFRRHYKIGISPRTVRRVLKEANLSYKRMYIRLKRPRNKKRKYKTFKKQMESVKKFQSKFGTSPRILSLDETGWSHGAIYPQYSWSSCGQKHKVVCKRYPEFLKPSMMCLTDSKRGIVDYEVLFGKAWNSQAMKVFLCRALVGYSGYYMIMDNVAFHHSKCIQKVLEAMGVTPVFIDPYTPEQNPIEELFSCVKSYVEARSPWTLHQFSRVLRQSLCRIKPKQVSKYFHRSLTGYYL